MKKKYEKPDIEITVFEPEDTICDTSGGYSDFFNETDYSND